EDAFIRDGWGVFKSEFMKDVFVIIGPKEDPAGVGVAETIGEALQHIAKSGATFISRGDRSGTHMKEVSLWKEQGIQLDGQTWYIKANTLSGNEGVMALAEEQKAYALVDLASFTTGYQGNAL